MKKLQECKPPQVLIITNLFPTPQEPLRGIFIYNMVKELKKICDVTIVAVLPWFPRFASKRFDKYKQFSMVPPRYELDGMEVFCSKYIALPKLGFLHPLFIFLSICPLVMRLKRKKEISIINAHWAFPDGVAVSWVARLLKLPFMISARGCDINLYSTYLMRKPQIVGSLKNAAYITTVSSAQKNVVERLGIKTDKIYAITNGVDSNQFRPRNKTECRKKLGLEEGKKIVLFVGQMVEVKGFNYLIDAVYSLFKKGLCDFNLAAVGEGPLRSQYEALVNKLGLGDRIKFYGEKSREELPQWYGACDLFCLPSLREGCPNVVLESLGSGRPVIASNVGGIPELVNEGNGILFPSKDAGAVADALYKAINKSWDEKRISDGMKTYTWENISKRFKEIYDQILAEQQKGAV